MATTDDYSADTTTAGILPAGGAATGNLDGSYDRDWFKITLAANTSYQILLASAQPDAWGSYTTPSLQVYDASGRSLYYDLNSFSVGKTGTPAIWIKPTTAGDYYIEVSASYSGTTGGYRLTALNLGGDDYRDNSSTTATLAPGGQITGTLELPRDRDMFEVNLEAGVTYSFNVAGTTDASGNKALPQLALYSAANVANGYPTISAMLSGSYTASTTGKYYVGVTDADTYQGVGGYVLSMGKPADDYAANAAGAGILKSGASQTGKLEGNGDIDWFKVSLDASQSYTFQLSAGGSASSTLLAVVDAQGNSLGGYTNRSADGTLQLDWTPPRAGDYYVQVSANGSSGDYTVQLSKTEIDDFADNRNTTGVLVAGGSTKGRIEAVNDTDWIMVSLQAGTSYTYGLSKATLNNGSSQSLSGLTLLDASGKTLQSASLTTAGEQVLNWTATSSGDYYLAVRGGYDLKGASYTVTSYLPLADAVRGDASTTTALQAGTVQKDGIDFVGDRDWYKFEVKGSYASYTFAVSGVANGGGTYDSKIAPLTLQVLDSSGKVVSYGAYASGSSDMSLSFYTYTPGTYYLQVGATGLATGSYTLLSGGDGKSLPDIRPPVAQSLSGPTKAAGKGVAENITIGFDETVQTGSGTIKLSLASGVLVETLDLANSTAVKASYNSLTLDPLLDLLPETDYVLELGIGTVKDTAGNANTSTITYNFHTVGANRQLSGTGGNDVFHAGTGNDTIDGGAGLDTVYIGGNSNYYSVSRGVLYTTVSSYYGGSGNLIALTSVERIQFDDRAIAFDARGDAGQVYRLYQAAFGRTPDSAGLGYWIAQADKGMTLHDVADSFVTSKEFQTLYGSNSSDAVFLASLYKNVLHRDADSSGLDYWGGELAHGMQRADVLTAFSESAENQLASNSITQYGISYIPYL